MRTSFQACFQPQPQQSFAPTSILVLVVDGYDAFKCHLSSVRDLTELECFVLVKSLVNFVMWQYYIYKKIKKRTVKAMVWKLVLIWESGPVTRRGAVTSRVIICLLLLFISFEFFYFRSSYSLQKTSWHTPLTYPPENFPTPVYKLLFTPCHPTLLQAEKILVLLEY